MKLKIPTQSSEIGVDIEKGEANFPRLKAMRWSMKENDKHDKG
jgi:hypothetical protein